MDFSQFYLAVFVLFAIIVVVGILQRSRKAGLPYYKNKNLLTNAELSFFKVLEQAVESDYYIFPQVRLSALVKINASGREWWRYFGKVKSKSVDFVLVDKKTLEPLLIIELDDISHNEVKRIERDKFVDMLFKAARMPFLRVKNSHGYMVNNLRSDIQQKIGEGKEQVG